MRKLYETELAILKRYKLVKSVKIETEEYENLLASFPQYVFIGNTPDELYKYVVPDEISEETLEQLERAEELKVQYDNNRQLKAANEELKEIREHLNEKLGALQYSVRIIKNITVGTLIAAIIYYAWFFVNISRLFN